MSLCQKLVSGFSSMYVTSHQRLFSPTHIAYTLIQRRVSEKHPIEYVEEQVQSVSSEVRNVLKDSDVHYFVDSIPKKLLRKQSYAQSSLYLVNPHVAKELSQMISNDLLENPSFVIKCNPGLGLLTRELLNVGVPSIYLYEKNDEFRTEHSPLHSLITKHKEKLHLRNIDFFKIWMTLLNDLHQNRRSADVFLAEAPTYDWLDKSFAQIIAVCPSRHFLACLIHNFFNQTNLFEHGRPTLFLVLPASIWSKFDLNNNYKNQRYNNQWSIMMNLCFEFKRLGEVPRKAFIPWPRIKSDYRELNAPMVVIKLEPKKSVFHLIHKDDLKAFWYFTKYCTRSKKIAIIAEFEKLVPGCGPRLIRLDFDIVTKFKELSPTQMLKLFQNFREWPEYNASLFMPSSHEEEMKKEDDDKVEGDEDSEKDTSEFVLKRNADETSEAGSGVQEMVRYIR